MRGLTRPADARMGQVRSSQFAAFAGISFTGFGAHGVNEAEANNALIFVPPNVVSIVVVKLHE